MSDRDKDFWDEFFEFVKSGRVIPILGPELLWIDVEGVRRPLYSEVADRLAQRLKVALPVQVANPLDDVARRFTEQGGKRADVFKKLHLVMNELSFEPPDVLKKIARIDDFKLYVSLTFDSLMVHAIDQERFQGSRVTQHLAYALNRVDDLPSEVDRLQVPVVYSLLGRHTVGPDYVVTEEDMLEFVSSLQSESRRPQLLFDELAHGNLLLLGCSFPDWLARFFIRATKSRPLSHGRDEWEYWVDTTIETNNSLVVFLDRFSKSTKRIPCDPSDFVDEMACEWERRRASRMDTHRAAAVGQEVLAGSEPDRVPAVFISYASQDLAAAEQLREALSSAGIVVWFDKERLDGGDLFERKIRTNIECCALFIPLLSRQTEQRPEGFFRREWRWADNRWQGIADAVPFIVPIVIDDTDPYQALVPDSFKAMQWMQLPPNGASDSAVSRIRALIREHIKRSPQR